MKINIKATGIELTESLKEYSNQKIEGLEKFFDNITQADIDIGIRSIHHAKGKVFYAEVNLHVPKKILRVVKDAEDLYKAIDKVKDHLKIELEKIKGKMRAKDRKSIRGNKEYTNN